MLKKFNKPIDGKYKEIFLNDRANEICVMTETPNPCSVSGVRNSIRRKTFKNSEDAKTAFDKMVVRALKDGWRLV